MSRVLQFPDERLDQEQAAAWIARLDRGLDASEREQLGNWLAQDARHRQALVQAASLWDRMDVLAELAQLFPLHEETVAGRLGGARRFAPAFIALVAVIGAVVAIRLHGGHAATQTSTAVVPGDTHVTAAQGRTEQAIAPFVASYATAVGEQRTVDLPGHSIIQLNTNTALQVEFTATARLIKMTRGEANFQVAKDPARVFTVRVAGFDFNAVGTAFDIRADLPQGVRLTVTQGRVRVNRTPLRVLGGVQAKGAQPGLNDFTEVEANKEVVVGQSSERIEALEPAQVVAATAWQRGMIVFEATPLEQVISELGRYSTTRFVITDPALGRIPVSGYFKLGDVDALASVLAHNFGIAVRKNDDLIVLSADLSK